jgi:hypothetical protein
MEIKNLIRAVTLGLFDCLKYAVMLLDYLEIALGH